MIIIIILLDKVKIIEHMIIMKLRLYWTLVGEVGHAFIMSHDIITIISYYNNIQRKDGGSSLRIMQQV